MKKGFLFSTLCLLLLSACGGGGGGSKTSNKPDIIQKQNTAPVITVTPLQGWSGSKLEGRLQAKDAEQDAVSFQLVQAPSFGKLELQTDGSFRYDIPALLPARTVSFSVTASDGQLKSAVSVFDINLAVSPGQPQPIPASYQVNKGRQFSGKLQAQTAEGEKVGFRVNKAGAGYFSADSAGNFVYMAPRQATQTSDLIEFQLDSAGSPTAQIQFSLNEAQNQPPVAQPAFVQVKTGQTETGQLQAIDPDGDKLSFSLVDTAASPYLQLQPDGRFQLDASYKPGAEPQQIRFRVYDGQVYSSDAVLTLLHRASAGQPNPLPAQFAVLKGQTFTGQLPALYHPDDQVRFVLYSKPKHGEFSVSQDGRFSYTVSKKEAASTDQLEFNLVYADKSTTLTTVKFQLIDAPNTAPQMSPQHFTLSKGTRFQGQLQALDADNDVLTFSQLSAAPPGQFSLQENGQFSYFVDRQETVTQVRIDVQVSDGSLKSYQQLVLNLTPFVNQAPVVEPLALAVMQDHFVDAQLSATDINNDPVSFSVVTPPAEGELQLQPDGKFRYLAAAGSTAKQSFSVQASDGSLQSAAVRVELNILPRPVLSGSSYQLFGEPGQVLAGKIRQTDEPVVGGQPLAGELTLMLAPRQGKVQLEPGKFSYQPANNNVLKDRFVVQFQDAEGKPRQARIELDYSEQSLLHNDASNAALAPEWQSTADFPPELKPILDGKNPFAEITDHSQNTAYQALRALDTLALRGDSSDLLLYRLGYYLRSYYFKTNSSDDTVWQPAQWQQLATVGRHLQQMPGFYSTSLSGAQLQRVYSDVVYMLQYHSTLETERLQSMAPVLLAVSLYQRPDLTKLPYEKTTAFYELMDYLDRLLYANIEVSAPALLLDRVSQLLTQLGTTQPLIQPDNSNPFWILNNLNNVATSLWYKSSDPQKPQVIATLAGIYRHALPAWTASQQQQLRARFYGHFFKRSLGYRQPEQALDLCQSSLTDVCLKLNIADVLPEAAQCGVPVRLTYDQLDRDQRQAVCGALDQTTSRFHQLMKTADQPLPDDHNDELEAVIFNSSSHYRDYAGLLYGIDTNNGGLYLEGDPADPQNQPRYFAYQQVTDGKWWVWNLEHEYTHYLDGRFIQKGDFGASQQMINSWWAEGLAEWVAWGEQFPRGFAVLRNTPADKRPDLNTLFRNNYENRDLTYHWSYALHYYLVKQQPALHLAMAECLKQGSAHCVRDLENRLFSEHSEPFARFVQALVDRLNKPGAAADSLYDLQQYSDELQQLDAHSQQHLQQQSAPAQRPLRPAEQPDRELRQ